MAGGAAAKTKRKAPLSKSKSKMKLDVKTNLAGAGATHSDGSEGSVAVEYKQENKGARGHPARGSDAAGDGSKREYAGAHQSLRGAQDARLGRPEASGAKSQARFKHASVATNGSLAKGALLSSPVHPSRSMPIPHNLANYTNLAALLDVLEPFCEATGYARAGKPLGGGVGGGGRGGGGGGSSSSSHAATPLRRLSASTVSDAVGALNRLKRLRSQVSSPAPCPAPAALPGAPVAAAPLAAGSRGATRAASSSVQGLASAPLLRLALACSAASACVASTWRRRSSRGGGLWC